MSQARAAVIIKGLVQGVSYRYYTTQTAQSLGLTGWVRNLPNGDVEALFEGARNLVQQMIEWCHQGPPAASVSEVLVDWQDASGEFDTFSVRR